jgi:hypothetical protein
MVPQRFSPAHWLTPVLAWLLLIIAFSGASAIEPETAGKLLPERAGRLRALTTVAPLKEDLGVNWAHFDALSAATREYLAPDGTRLVVTVVVTASDSAAYALQTFLTPTPRPEALTLGEIGTTSFHLPHQITFTTGRAFVEVETADQKPSASLADAAGWLVKALPKGEGEVPVLLKHLPDWERAQSGATYFVTLESLQARLRQPVFDAVSFAGAEAVHASYGSSQLVIVEFATPQLATENDRRIAAKLEELKGQGQALPSTYRRVGNYSVFVFDAPDEQTAKELVDQIKYEQVTKWLGDSPYPLLEAQRRYTATTLGVLVSVVKASGLALLTCLTAGGLIGALLFLRRRAQQRMADAYSDAGGMLRLNLDEMTPQTDPARLIGPSH